MTKDKVLAILKRSGSCVSGEEMSRALGVSRAAVNTAVMALRSDGYEIGSGTNRGYELKNAPDRLNMGELMALLPEERLKKVVCLDSVDSTNDRLRAMAMDGAPDGQIVLANCQTRGKGRLGREFRSPADKGVYMSLLLRPESAPADLMERAEDAGLRVIRYTGQEDRIRVANELPGAPARYDMRSRCDALFGGHNGYLYEKQQVLDDVCAFVRRALQQAPC